MAKSDTARILGGCLRRRVCLRSPTACLVTGHVQDDFHDFAVSIEHDGERITRVVGEARRFPWTTCPGAVEPLRALEGAPLFRRAGNVASLIDAPSNCTHLLDLAGLAIAHASRPAGEDRVYEAVVPDRAFRDRRGSFTYFEAGDASLFLDGKLVLQWRIEEPYILAPSEFAGVHLFKGFGQRIANLDDDSAEAALILRRAVHIAGGRAKVVRQTENASQMGVPPVCHSFQPDIMGSAINTRVMARDFSRGIDGLVPGHKES